MKGSPAKKAAAAGGVVVAACAVCCAPLLVAPIMALAAAGGAGLAFLGQVGLGVAAFAGIGLYLVLRRRAAARRAPACGCAPAAPGRDAAARQSPSR